MEQNKIKDNKETQIERKSRKDNDKQNNKKQKEKLQK